MNTNSKTRVLVFPGGTEIGLEIQRALHLSTHVDLIGASSVASNHGPYVFHKYYNALPFVHDPAFVPRMRALIEDEGVDMIYPAHDDVVVALARHASSLRCDIIASPLATCTLCRSKSATYARFRGLLSVPRIYARSDPDPVYPLFLKPDAGQGARGTRLITSPSIWDAALEEDPGAITLEYLPGDEYTVDCFSDRHGRLRFAGPRSRLRTMNGISVHSRPVPADPFTPLAQRIHDTLTFRGAWFFQVKRNVEGRLTLLEISPRVSGGMGLYRNLGVNLPLLSVYDRLGQHVALCPLSHDLEMDRALGARFRANIDYGHVYLDLDDTLLCQGKVNPMMAAFLHQCRNAGKTIHLLTRHAGTLEHTLEHHGLSPLFDTVVHLGPTESKATHIHHDDALFIDDSHAERQSVYTMLGIPVFAPDAVESLLDWRA